MKKDIHIPEVTDVYVAVVEETNAVHNTKDWNAYIINNKTEDLDVVLIVSHGYSTTKTTATFRKKIDQLPKKSYAKFELLEDSIFALNNQFKVTFFIGNTLYDKTYTFTENSINKNAFEPIPLMDTQGVLAK